MMRREELYEQCEDAIFALLMEDFIEEEGRRLLEKNKALKADPTAAVPELSYRKGLKSIQRSFGAQRRRRAGKTAYRVINKVAMIALIAGLLFSTAFAASPTLRRETLNFVISITEGAADLQLFGSSPTAQKEAETNSYILGNYRFPACPAGYELYAQDNDEHSSFIAYTDENNNLIQMTVMAAQDTIMSLDSEDAQRIEEIQIHGYDGLLIEKNGTFNIAYADTQKDVFVQIYTSGLSENATLALLEEITSVP